MTVPAIPLPSIVPDASCVNCTTNVNPVSRLAFPECAPCRTVRALLSYEKVNTKTNHGIAVPANPCSAHATSPSSAEPISQRTLNIPEESRMATDKQKITRRLAMITPVSHDTHTLRCTAVTAQQGPSATIATVSIHETLKYGSSPCTDHVGIASTIARTPAHQDADATRALMYVDAADRPTAIAVTPIQGETIKTLSYPCTVTPTPPVMTRPPIYQGEIATNSPLAKIATGALQPAATTAAPTVHVYNQIPLHRGTPNQARTECPATHTCMAPSTPPLMGSGSRPPTPKGHIRTSNSKEMFALSIPQECWIPPHRWK
jgi:hypothetical protein